MGYQLAARVLFAAATFSWALAGSLGAAGVGWGALGAAALALPLAFWRPADLKAAFCDRYVWATGAAFALTNVSLALATDLLPLATLAAISQLSPLAVLAIAPLWGERAQRGDWGIATLGILGALLVVGTGLEDAPPAGFLAAGAFVLAVAISSHLWGAAARKSQAGPAAAILVLFLPSLPFLLLAGPSPDVPLYMVGGALFALGNALMYLAYQRGWTVVRSVLLKPLVALLLAASGVLFLGNEVTAGLVAGSALILLAVSLVRRPE